MAVNSRLPPATQEALRRAAGGDVVAQRELTIASLEEYNAAKARGEHVGIAVVEALLWARMTAVHGDAGDDMRLARALICTGNEIGLMGMADAAVNVTAEAVAIIRGLAVDGDPQAQVTLEQVIADIPPDVLRRSTALLEARHE
jgi:hypothetical protein